MDVLHNTTFPDFQGGIRQPLPPLIRGVPDSITSVLVPIIAYWALSLLFLVFDEWDLFAQYRLHTPEELTKRNLVGRWDCAWNVMTQQIGQLLTGIAFGYISGPEMAGKSESAIVWWAGQLRSLYQSLSVMLAPLGVGSALKNWNPDLVRNSLHQAQFGFPTGSLEYQSWDLTAAVTIERLIVPALRLFIALCVIDTWQYFFHRLMHMNSWCYRNWHSQHHKLYVPYSFGALYGSRAEGFLSETIGAFLAFALSGMSTREAMVLFTFGSIKAVDDHSGYVLPWDPLQYVTKNNAAYHDIHHQSWGLKTNFSQPFFTFWDNICGTQWKGSRGKRHIE